MSAQTSGASFRDPSGFIFRRDGVLYRQINTIYQAEFEQLQSSGLYDALRASGELVSHEEAPLELAASREAWKIIRPETIRTISYPYEWCFSQLKDAALLTLRIQQQALNRGMSLKDATAYNVQFHRGRPVFIDTLSFERFVEGKPWVAYRQFCQHFLAPLALMSKTDIRLNQLLRIHLDGVPLDLASKLLPKRTKFNLSLGLHIHAHARSQKKYEGVHDAGAAKSARRSFSRRSLETIISSLISSIEGLSFPKSKTEWADYYEANNNYGAEGLGNKGQALRGMIQAIAPKSVWDLGGNTGVFSRIAAESGADVVTWDIDPACVEFNYRQVREKKETQILPLLQDLTNPSPALGWANDERMSLAQRGPVDCIMALGLIHHLAISNNVPLERVADWFTLLGRSLIIEFVPKEDSQVQKLLSTRQDIFSNYTREGFEKAFGGAWSIEQSIDIPATKRTLYRMKIRS